VWAGLPVPAATTWEVLPVALFINMVNNCLQGCSKRVWRVQHAGAHVQVVVGVWWGGKCSAARGVHVGEVVGVEGGGGMGKVGQKVVARVRVRVGVGCCCGPMPSMQWGVCQLETMGATREAVPTWLNTSARNRNLPREGRRQVLYVATTLSVSVVKFFRPCYPVN